MTEAPTGTQQGPSVRSAILCITAVVPGAKPSQSQEGDRWVVGYSSTGEFAGFASFNRFAVKTGCTLLAGDSILARVEDNGNVNIRVTLNPTDARVVFESVEFHEWNKALKTIITSCAGCEPPEDWKDRCGQLLVLEAMAPVSIDPDTDLAMNRARQWLGFLGQDNTGALPSQLEDKLLISPPHVMGQSPRDRAACIIVGPSPGDMANSADLMLPDFVELLLDAWRASIHAAAVGLRLSNAAFAKFSLTEYLGKVGWKQARWRRLAQYEEKVLQDREESLELLLEARHLEGELQRHRRLITLRKSLERCRVLDVGRSSVWSYAVASDVSGAIYRPIDGIESMVFAVETKMEAVSGFLRDAAAAHIARASWRVQIWLLVMTVVTIGLGLASACGD